ncbi:MAG: 30S ribosomal protein S6 [Proteobacteria bacterium]|nr:MAG: 30S ribosomal protein S6 [Pseudomonadota bacterium]
MFARKYETIVIVNPESGEEGLDRALGRMREALESTGGREVRLEDWGVRRLAYELGKSTKGHYLYMLFLGANTTVVEMERLLQITEPVLKYQTILLEDRVAIEAFDFEAASKELSVMGRQSQRQEVSA